MEEKVIKLSILQELFNNKEKYKLNTEKGYQGVSGNSYSSDGVQGEYDEKFIFYRHPEMDNNLFMRETYNTDSYGYNDSLVKIEFVKGKTKKITVFEPIN